MGILTCEICGGTLVMDKDREFSVCENCGCKYSREAMRGMIENIVAEPGMSEHDNTDISAEDALMIQAAELCAMGQFAAAKKTIEKALLANSEIAEYHLVALMVERACNYEESLGELTTNNLSESQYYQAAFRLGEDDLKKSLEAYDTAAKERYAAWLSAETERKVQIAIGRVGEWMLLKVDKRNKRGLYLARDIIELLPFHSSKTDVSWEESSLRKWLNNDFYYALPAEIKDRVIEVFNRNLGNPEAAIPRGKATKDKVFLLSLEELHRYFPEREERMATLKGIQRWWWLRTPGHQQDYAMNVSSLGQIGTFGSRVNRPDGVRPALWLRLEG